ncbi:MAG TPA: vitamin K epoxide reductase family protein [Pyrinomonadaceae bacterium]|nr:vitamin K epoxide reductase family protein [Pyrinomonadaceae bacterium]
MGAIGSERAASANERAGETTSPPRVSRLYALAAVLSLAGLADAVYLTVEHLTGRSVRCTVTSGCSEVLASPYATIGDYPLALLGALAYFTAFSLATLAAFGSQRAGNLFALLVGLMFAVSLWLLYLQAFVLHAFCQYCLLSAAITTLLAGLAVARRAWK